MDIFEIKDIDGDIIIIKSLIQEKEFLISVIHNVDMNIVQLNPDQINQLITHLSNQLQSIGVQVDILKEK